MEELIQKLQNDHGLSADQSHGILNTITGFIKEKFPMVGGAIDNLFQTGTTPSATGTTPANTQATTANAAQGGGARRGGRVRRAVVREHLGLLHSVRGRRPLPHVLPRRACGREEEDGASGTHLLCGEPRRAHLDEAAARPV